MAVTLAMLEDLPNELLFKCFNCLASSREDLQSLRLVSRRCLRVSSPILVDYAKVYTVYITSQSLNRFEKLSQYPPFSLSVQNVEISASYFDAKLAADRSLFGEHCGTKLQQNLECFERGMGFRSRNPETKAVDLRSLWAVADEWAKVPISEGLQGQSTKGLCLLLNAHNEYQLKYEDQKKVKEQGAHIERICAALSRLHSLRSVAITDKPYYRHRSWPEGEFSDEGLLDSCLQTSRWKGSFTTAFVTEPPVSIIPELFISLAKSGVRPAVFEIRITPPTSLICLQLSKTQQEAIKSVVEKSEKLVCQISRWARKDSLAEDNDRTREEMLALGSLTTAFFDTASLKTMELSFDDYPVFGQRPQTSLADVLPLSRSWPCLQHISWRHVPFHLQELEGFVANLSETVRGFDTYSIMLLDRSWCAALDILRKVEGLEDFNCQYPMGREFGENHRAPFLYLKAPKEAMRNYVLRTTDLNPLLNGFMGISFE